MYVARQFIQSDQMICIYRNSSVLYISRIQHRVNSF